MGNTRETETHLRKLALEDVDLVEKENDGRPEEPSRVDDGIKQGERLGHSSLQGGLCQLSLFDEETGAAPDGTRGKAAGRTR